MPPTYDDFLNALGFLVRIEPEPDTYTHMEEYDAIMAPYAAQIDAAEATIRAYGHAIAPQGLAAMQSVLYGLLDTQRDPKAYAVIEATVNAQWHGCGDWRG